MTFTDVSFFLFLALSLLVYRFLVPLKQRWLYLLVLGVLFYCSMDVRFLYVLGVMVVVTYAGSWILANTKHNRYLTLWISVSSIVAWLFLVKWPGTRAMDWFGPAHALWPGGATETFAGLAVPIGISFHALQCISALVDTYRFPLKWDSRPGMMLLYLCYLPQILAGPIERVPNMYPQFEAPRQDSPDEALQGLELVVKGLFKKLVLADRFSVILIPYVASPSKYLDPLVSGFIAITWVTYIYFDLSGYTDMARGISNWFGIKLTRNFDAPFRAKTLQDFWTRWHVTFHLFMRDYLFRGLKKARVPLLPSVFIVFIVSGLWHGLGLQFTFWAGSAFVFVMIEALVLRRFPGYKDLWFTPLLNYFVISVSCTFFYIQHLADAKSVYGSFWMKPELARATAMMHELGWQWKDLFIYVGFMMAGLIVFHRKEELPRSLAFRWAMLVAVGLAILILKNPTTVLHSYFKF